MSTTPLTRRQAVRLAGVVMLLGVIAGCGQPSLTCANIANADACDRVMDAALRELPSGAISITAGSAASVTIPPYPVVACYSDGTSIALEVTLRDDGADVGPWAGGQLPDACDP